MSACSGGSAETRAAQTSPTAVDAGTEPAGVDSSSEATETDGSRESSDGRRGDDGADGRLEEVSDPDGATDEGTPWVDAPEDFDDEPEPAESIVSTLCNLTSEYVGGLADVAEASNGEELHLAVLALSDHVAVWQSLAGHYPELADEIGTAEEILALWRGALGYYDEGNVPEAEAHLSEARSKVEQLPSLRSHTEVNCGG